MHVQLTKRFAVMCCRQPYKNEALVSTSWHAYDAVTLLALSIHNLTEQHKDITGPNVMSLIRSGNIQFNGVVGTPLKFVGDGDPVPNLVLTNFKDGQFQPVGTWVCMNVSFVLSAQHHLK
jgi:hypothetical protein